MARGRAAGDAGVLGRPKVIAVGSVIDLEVSRGNRIVGRVQPIRDSGKPSLRTLNLLAPPT